MLRLYDCLMKSVRLFTVVIAAAAGMSQRALMAAEPSSVALPRSAHSLRVIVDPRVEFLSVIFRLAGNPEYNRARVKSYAEDAENQFGKFRGCAVVNLAQALRPRCRLFPMGEDILFDCVLR